MAISQSDFDRLLKGLDTPQQTFLNTYQQSNPLTSNQMESFANAPGAFLSSIGFGGTTPAATRPTTQETSSENWWNTPPSGGAEIVQPGTGQQTGQTQQPPVPSWAQGWRVFYPQDGSSPRYINPQNGLAYDQNGQIIGNAQQSTPQVYGGYGAWGQSGLGWNTPGSFNVSGGLNNVPQGQAPGIQPTQPGATGQTGSQGQGFDLNGLLQALQGQFGGLPGGVASALNPQLSSLQTGLGGLGQQQTTGFENVSEGLKRLLSGLGSGFGGLGQQISGLDLGYKGPSATDISGNVQSALSPDLQNILSGLGGLGQQQTTGFEGISGNLKTLLSQLGSGFGGLGQQISGIDTSYRGPSSTNIATDVQSLLNPTLTGLPAGVLAEIQRNPQFAQLLGLTGEGGLLGTGAGSLSQGQMGIGNQLTDVLSALGEGGILGQGQTGISAQLAQLLDPTSGIFGQSGFGGIIPTIEELGGLRTAIQTDLSPIQAQLNTLTQQLNQEPDITPQDFISQFWGGFQEILDGLPEGTTVTPGEGGSYTVQPPGDQEAFTFTPPDMGDIPDNRSVYRDAYSDLVLGNTGANNLVGQELVNAIGAPNPYAEVEGSVLGEIIRQINQDAETGRKNLENQYAVTNKLDIPLFKEQTQNYEGKVLNDIGNARVNFGLQRAASEESTRRNRLSDLLNFNQTQIGNTGNALQGAIGERSGEIGLQQNIYNQALQNFLNTINQNNAITTAQYGFGDTGLNMGLNALGYATSPSSATAASGIFGQLASQNQGGWNNLIQLLQNPSLYGG